MKLNCPKCHAEQEAAVISTIAPGSQECKDLFAGKLNRITCPHCGTAYTVDQPLIYRDASTDPSFILYYMEPPEDGNTEAIEQQIDGMATDVFAEKNLARPIVRLVFGLPDFIEKIAIRQMGFDDRLVEYAKLELFRNIEEPKLSRRLHRLLLDYSHCDDEKLIFLIFDRETQKVINAIQVSMDEFRSLMEHAETDEHIPLELEAAFPGCYVSADRLL